MGIYDRIKNSGFSSESFTYDSYVQFGRYLITGILSFSLQYLIFVILYKLAGLWYMLASLAALVIVFWFNFLMNAFWSFGVKGNFIRQLRLYSILFFVNMGLTYIFLRFLTDYLGIIPLVSYLIVMGSMVLWNFVIYKKVIYV